MFSNGNSTDLFKKSTLYNIFKKNQNFDDVDILRILSNVTNNQTILETIVSSTFEYEYDPFIFILGIMIWFGLLVQQQQQQLGEDLWVLTFAVGIWGVPQQQQQLGRAHWEELGDL